MCVALCVVVYVCVCLLCCLGWFECGVCVLTVCGVCVLTMCVVCVLTEWCVCGAGSMVWGG